MDASEVIQSANRNQELIQEQIRKAADWFHSHEEELFERTEAVDKLAESHDFDTGDKTSRQFCLDLIISLVGDHVDPIQQVQKEDGKYVGVINYTESEGYYIFSEFNDVAGEYKRAVCGHCINDSTRY